MILLDRRSLSLFLAVSFGLGWLLMLAPLLARGSGDMAYALAVTAAWGAAMWAPGLGAIAATRWGGGQLLRDLGLNRLGPIRYYFWAWSVPIICTAAAFGMTVAFGLVTPSLTTALDPFQAAGAASEIPAAALLAIAVVFALTLAPIMNVVFALGEELGWRAYLLPALMHKGSGKALLISGGVWGVWHAPVIAQGHNYPNHPVLGVFLMIGACILLGVIMGWLYLATGSVWAPALGHATLNAVAGLPLLTAPDVNMALGGTVTSLAGWIPLAALAAWLWLSGRLTPRPAPPAENGAPRSCRRCAAFDVFRAARRRR